ncbi:hypothetical protein ACF0H5_023189 [Mactra antiquata]
MASTGFHNFGSSYEASNIEGPVQHRRLSHSSNHGRYHPYTGRYGYNRSSTDDLSTTCLQSFQPLTGYPHVPIYSDYFVTPAFSAYQGMIKDTMSGPVPVPNMTQKIMNENMLGLHSINMEPSTLQTTSLSALQDVCSPPQVSDNSRKISQQVYDKSRSHPFYWRKRSEPSPGMTRTRDKYRIVYTEKQRIGLEKSFDENKFISMKKKTELSKQLDLSERQIKIWFQNRRAKERRESRRSQDNSDEDNTVNTEEDYVNTENNSSVLTTNTSNNCRLSSCRFDENIPIIDNTTPSGTRQDDYTQHILTSDNFIPYENTCMRSMRPISEQRYSLSPSEMMNSTLQQSISSNNVSPLNVNMDFGLYQRM